MTLEWRLREAPGADTTGATAGRIQTGGDEASGSSRSIGVIIRMSDPGRSWKGFRDARRFKQAHRGLSHREGKTAAPFTQNGR